MISRDKILEAARRVYAKHGFRGATTRLIAMEAGVNEVTLFRTFGSKSALLEAVLQRDDGTQIPELPTTAGDPVAELTAFVEGHLTTLREVRPLILHAMSELEERPEAADFACRGRSTVHSTLRAYAKTLQAQGVADSSADVATAVTMLTSAVMGDAMGRPMDPSVFPPIDEAAERYVRCFLAAIGVTVSLTKRGRTARVRTA
jgi:AcrR family transcriptional regulator